MIHLPEAALPFLLQQRTRYGALPRADVGQAFSEEVTEFAERLRPYLPAPRSRMCFLDIGCGLGFSLLGMRSLYGADHRFIGIDREQQSPSVSYGFSEQPSVYNSLSITRQVLAGAGIRDEDIELIDLDRQSVPAVTADIVTSTLAWGFHFPVAAYLTEVNGILPPGGTLVIDLRRGLNQEAELLEHYDCVQVWPALKSDRLVLCRR